MGINLNIILTDIDQHIIFTAELSKKDTINTLRALGFEDTGEGVVFRRMPSKLAFDMLCSDDDQRLNYRGLPPNYLYEIRQLKNKITTHPDSFVSIVWY